MLPPEPAPKLRQATPPSATSRSARKLFTSMSPILAPNGLSFMPSCRNPLFRHFSRGRLRLGVLDDARDALISLPNCGQFCCEQETAGQWLEADAPSIQASGSGVPPLEIGSGRRDGASTLRRH